MAVTSRLSLPYPLLSDAADANAAVQPLAEILDNAALWDQGVLASRPVSTPSVPGIAGRFYRETDSGIVSVDTGTGWDDLQPGAGSITPSMIADTWRLLPSGAVVDWPFAAADVPAGFVLPYGQAVNRADYARLNTLAANAGYPDGAGNGTTTFNLPDYRGRVGVGKDDMGGTAANRVTTAGSGINGTSLGAAGGTETHTLTVAQIPSHTHTLNGNVSPSISNTSGLANGGGAATITTDATGGGGSHPNVQPSIIVNKILAT